MQNIIGLKFIGGMDMICKVDCEIHQILTSNTGTITVDNAIYAQPYEVGDGQFDIRFFPVSMIAATDDRYTAKVDVNLSTVLYAFPIKDIIEEKYRQVVSPIILASGSL